jgi:hypothetical protein
VSVLLNELKEHTLQDQIEILGNVFIQMGGSHYRGNETLTIANIFNLAYSDLQQNGNNVWNSLVLQGVTLMDWANKL